MAKHTIASIQKRLKKTLDEDRYIHTLGVSYTACALAMRYEYSITDAQMAGLLHDCAKCIPKEKQVMLCEKHHINISDFEKRNPFLLHAKLGAFFAMRKYGVTNKEIIGSILCHTTGKPNMTLLEKIIYIADYIEPQRVKQPHLPELRKLAFLDIDQALFQILQDTLSYLQLVGGEIDPMTQKAFEYYRDKLK